MSDIGYWYDGLGGANLISDLPPQAIPSSQKTEKWKKANMNALERIGIKQFHENKRFSQYYQMVDGKLSFMELSDLIPQLREVGDMMEKYKLTSTIKHYDILGIIVNYLQSVIVENKGKFHPSNIDEIYQNEYQRKKTELLHNFILEQWNRDLKIKLVEAGLDPDRTQFYSEEEKQAYIQQIEQTSQAMTPPEIERYMSSTWKSAGIQWAEATLKADNVKLKMDEIDRHCIKDYLLTGRMFQESYVSYDSYGVRPWSPINTFFSQTVDVRYPQYGEYIGRVHFYTPSDFINQKGEHFTEAQMKKILNNSESSEFDGENISLETAIENNFHKNHLVPFDNFYDYNFMLNLQDELGIPLATRTIHRKDGSSDTFSDFLPKSSRASSNINRYASFLREDLNLRQDMIMVTTAYWRSYKRIGFLSYITPEGRPESTIVTDELYMDFLAENGIKTLRNVKLEEAIEKREPNTISWHYVPEIWQGEKANTSATRLAEDMYYNIKPMDYQIKGDSNLFDLQLPVAGLVDKNPSDKVMPYQYLVNVALNKDRDLHEKELGVFFLFDVNWIPSDIKEYGDTETALLEMTRIIRDTGMLGVDGGKTNNTQGSPFNQFTVLNASMSEARAALKQEAEYYKNKAFEQFGLNPQVLGQPVKYQTATGVDQSIHATQSQTDYLYENFSNFKSRQLEIHLATAQYAQSNGKDLSVVYNKSELSTGFLMFSDEDQIPLRRFGIIAESDPKKRREVEMIKQYMLNQNTMDTDSLEMSSIISSDSLSMLMEIARLERQRKELIRQNEMRHEQQLIDKQLKANAAAEQKKWENSEVSKEADRQNKIDLKELDAIGRAADNDASMSGLEYIKFTADQAHLREKDGNDYDLRLKELGMQLNEAKNKYKLEQDKLAIEKRKLDIEEKKIKSEEYKAEINKN